MVGCTRISVSLSEHILPHGQPLNQLPPNRLPPDRLSFGRPPSGTPLPTPDQSWLHDQGISVADGPSAPQGVPRHDQNHESGGARIPAELFDDILFHVGSHYSSHNTEWDDIAACSLVCLYWANQCRRHMFSGVTLCITSPARAEMFVKYATRGCPALIPVHALIRNIEVEQRYDAPRSFCYRLHLFKSRLGGQLAKLTLSGPVSAGFPSYKLDTPHWSQPHTIPTPPSLLPYSEALAHHIHLPSFAHVTKYIQHFEYIYKLSFDHLTWDGGGAVPHSFLRFRRSNSRKLANNKGSIYEVTGCTDNSRLCLHIAMTHRWSLLHMLDDNERQWMIILLQQLHGSFSHTISDPPESCHWVNTVTVSMATETPTSLVEAQISTMIKDVHKAWIFSFTLELGGNRSDSQDLAATNTHVVGLEAWLGWKSEDEEDFQVNIDQLMSSLRSFTMLRVIILNFCSYRHLLGVMRRYRPIGLITHPEIDDHRQYVLVFRRQKGDRRLLGIPKSYKAWVGIDPITLSLTGQSWSNTDDIVRPLLAQSRAH